MSMVLQDPLPLSLCFPRIPSPESVIPQDPLQPFHRLCGPVRHPSPHLCGHLRCPEPLPLSLVPVAHPRTPYPVLPAFASVYPAMGITAVIELFLPPNPHPKSVSPAVVLANSSSHCFGPKLDVAVATMDKNIPRRRRKKQEKAHRGVKTNPTGSGGLCVMGLQGRKGDGIWGYQGVSVTLLCLAEPSRWRYMTGTVMAGELCVVLGIPHTLDLHPPCDRDLPPRWHPWGDGTPLGFGDLPVDGNPPRLFGTPWLMGNFLGNGKPPIPTPLSDGEPPG